MPYLEPSGSNSAIQPLPSLPPSPTEEDLSGASAWHEVRDDEDGFMSNRLSNGSAKGKERAREVSLDEDEYERGELTPTVGSGYPPLKDEEEESRRIEQNLKRLEEEERQRRKAARENAASSSPTSVVSDVSRRASLLFTSRRSGSGGSSRSRPPIYHVHSQLGQSSEDALPLSDLNTSGNSLVSPSGSKPSSPIPRSTATLPIPTIPENPFEPPDSATPLRSFPRHQDDLDGEAETSSSAVMRPSSPPPLVLESEKGQLSEPTSPFADSAADRPPTLQVTTPFSRPHPSAPPPLPIDIPPPKTPPPRTHTPGGSPVIVTTPPRRKSTPLARSPSDVDSADQDLDQREHRWWTDWLCGCREDKDRDNAARTNPFE